MTVRYGATVALDAVDRRIAPGERVALVGSSGAGKTTLLEAVSGLVTPSRGRVLVGGTEQAGLRGRALRQLRRRVGVVGQDHGMALSLRVVHNVRAGRLGSISTIASLWSLLVPSDRAGVTAALDRVGLADRVDARTDELSGGERQRIAVARVLHQCPALVLADEPTSSVDPELAGQVMDQLCGRSGETAWTTIVSVHSPHLARRHTDRTIGLRAGRVVFDMASDDVDAADLEHLYRL